MKISSFQTLSRQLTGAKIRQDIFDTQAELAERSSVFQEISKGAPAAVAPASDSEPEVTPAQMAEYRNALARVDQFRKKEQDLLTQFTEESTRVKGVRAQLAEAESLKKKLEEEHPGLTRTVVAVPSSTADATAPAVNLVTEAARVNALQAKIKVLNAQLEEVRTDARETLSVLLGEPAQLVVAQPSDGCAEHRPIQKRKTDVREDFSTTV